MMMTMNTFSQYIKYMYYRDIYLNPPVINKLLLLTYRIILGLIATYFFLSNNILLTLQLIDTFEINYFNGLIDNNYIDIDQTITYDEDLNNIDIDQSITYDEDLNSLYILSINPINQGGTSSSNSFGFGPSGRGPGGGDPVGTESTIENENINKRKRKNINNDVEPKIKDNHTKFKFIKKRKLFHEHYDFRL